MIAPTLTAIEYALIYEALEYRLRTPKLQMDPVEFQRLRVLADKIEVIKCGL